MDEGRAPFGSEAADKTPSPGDFQARKEKILRERAKVLARPSSSQAAPGGAVEVVSFRLGAERYAVESRHVGEIFPLRGVTPLPGTPSFVLGIVNLRGEILSLMDLKVLLRLPRDPQDCGVVLVLRSDGMAMGVVADAFDGVLSIPRGEIAPPLASLSSFGASVLSGLWRGEVALLDAGRILKDPSLVVNVEE
ncbi:MAG TPA: chemotaxis protein CheW [Synergistaceae bacterium]|nr:chemotaxis protein CheW [Synergistaceae bacterium]